MRDSSSSTSAQRPLATLTFSLVLALAFTGCDGGEVDCEANPTDPTCVSEPEPTPTPATDAGQEPTDAGAVEDAGPTCPEGTVGCACGFNNYCEDGACEDGVCVETACIEGELGCACGFNDHCNAQDGVLADCVNGICEVVVVDDTPAPGRPNDECYTPCSGNLSLPDGTFRFCSAEGYMAGCIAGMECNAGSCVEPGESPRACASADECPSHQGCIMGTCRSNCEIDSDCVEGAECSAYVCRLTCNTTGDECGAGERCESSNGVDGVCVPSLEDVVEAAPDLSNAGLFSVDNTLLAFTNNLVSGEFTVANETTYTQVFSVRKVEHSTITTDGRDVETTQPLFWLEMGDATGTERTAFLEFEVLPGETHTVVLDAAFNEALNNYEGRLEVGNDKLGFKEVALTYASRPDGEWAGTLYTFMDFDDTDIDVWLEALNTGTLEQAQSQAELTNNAFLAKWTEFRRKASFTKRQFDAVLASTLTGSWDNNTVKQACAENNQASDVYCYLYASPNAQGDDNGTRVYTEDPLIRIPTGVVEMPVSLRLQQSLDHNLTYQGRVESSATLQTPGLPPVSLTFGADPTSCDSAGDGVCLVQIADFSIEARVGGRFIDDGSNCGSHANFLAADTPWYVENFTEGTIVSGGRRVRRECRESAFPVDPSADGAQDLNLSFAGANPIADGRPRKRSTRLLDGLLVNQDTLLLLVQETFSANLTDDPEHPADFSAYGIMELRRSGSNIEGDGYVPGVVPDDVDVAAPEGKLDLSCNLDLVREALGNPTATIAGNEEDIATTLLTGLPASNPPSPVDVSEVHYLCHETGRFDGGFDAWDEVGGEECPLGSNITYFLYDGGTELQNASCNGSLQDRCASTGEAGDTVCPQEQHGTCATVLDGLVASGQATLNPAVVCLDNLDNPDPTTVICDDDRADMREGKAFYAPKEQASEARVFTPLRSFILDAFRYKSRFTTRDGNTPGFVPTVCTLTGDQLPYCYDPAAIEEAKDRSTCLLSLFASGSLDGTAIEDSVEDFLLTSFAKSGTEEGFEHLYAELLIMLGDDDFTNAVASRFDLAGTNAQLFEGDLLEPEGMQIAGSAGYEMLLLYRARQTFQLVLDRFHNVSPTLWKGVSEDGPNVVSFASIPTYFHRLSLASARKAKIAGEIAKKYQSFNRADLARHVLEKAYVEAYVESVELTQFMRRTINVVDTSQVDALRYEIKQLNLKYNQALTRMREQYAGIVDEITFFGDAPNFVPFPAPGAFSTDGPVDMMLQRAFDTAQVAGMRETRALESNRSFDTDAALFQSELAKLRQRYEGQLADICGTMEGYDGNFYPAIEKYAEFNPIASYVGNPCGFMGNGHLYDAMVRLEGEAAELRAEIADIHAIFDDARIEQERVDAECAGRVDIAQVNFDIGEVINLEHEIDKARNDIQGYQRELGIIDAQAALANSIAAAAQAATSWGGACQVDIVPILGVPFVIPPNPVACGTAVAASAAATASLGVAAGFQGHALATQRAADEDMTTKQGEIADKEKQIAEIRQAADYQADIMQCCLDERDLLEDITSCENPGPLMINSEARVDTIMLGLMRAELEAKRQEIEMLRVHGEIKGMRAQAKRIALDYEESNDLLVAVTAAKNDPNVRIFANADVLSADKAFNDALKDAYRATRTYEYYTATTYARKGDLFLVRMVNHGTDNLEDYLYDLQRDFREFEQQYGRPAERVAMVSLRDDIFSVARTNDKGVALLPAERAELLREMLLSPDNLDGRGHIRIPFSTTLSQTSPATAIHKVVGVEAEIHGSDLGDRVGRIYLTSKGTSTLRGLDDVQQYLRTPEVTAVINPYFNGVRVFDNDVYRNDRLQDRAFVNTLWELTLNLKDEAENADINPNSITDIRLYFFYEDFSTL